MKCCRTVKIFNSRSLHRLTRILFNYLCNLWENKKTAPKKEAVLTQKIVVRLSKSVYRFYEPLIFFDIDVCQKQTDYRNRWENRLNTLLRKIYSSG